MPRNACVIQITPVRLTRTIANDASVVRKIYLSIDPIVTARSRPRQLDCSPRPIPKSGSPWPRAIPQAGSVSHYHPFDPSTKWLSHGTLDIRLIIRAMWPPSHANAWQRGRGRVIVLGTMLSTAGIVAEENISSTPGGSSDPTPALIFGGFSYVRRRQGRLRSVFHGPPRRPGGVFRRVAEVRRGHPQDAGSGRQSGQTCRRGEPVQGKERIRARHPGATGSQGVAPDRDWRRQALGHQG